MSQEKAVLIFRASALVQAAYDIDGQRETCGSVRAGRILERIANKLRDDAVGLRKQADSLKTAQRNEQTG